MGRKGDHAHFRGSRGYTPEQGLGPPPCQVLLLRRLWPPSTASPPPRPAPRLDGQAVCALAGTGAWWAGLSGGAMPGNTLTWQVLWTQPGGDRSGGQRPAGMGPGSERLKCFKEPAGTEGSGLSSEDSTIRHQVKARWDKCSAPRTLRGRHPSRTHVTDSFNPHHCVRGARHPVFTENGNGTGFSALPGPRLEVGHAQVESPERSVRSPSLELEKAIRTVPASHSHMLSEC